MAESDYANECDDDEIDGENEVFDDSTFRNVQGGVLLSTRKKNPLKFEQKSKSLYIHPPSKCLITRTNKLKLWKSNSPLPAKPSC